MCHSYFNPYIICQFLQIFFENIMPTGIAAAAIGKHKNACCQWIHCFSVINPPIFYAFAVKFAGVFAVSKRYVSHILFDVIYAMRDNCAF